MAGEVPDGCLPNFLDVMTQHAFVTGHAPSNSLLAVDVQAKPTPPLDFNDGEIFFEQAAIHNAITAASGQFVANLQGDITTEQVLLDLLIHGRCGVQQPYTVEGGTREFDFGFVSSTPLREFFNP